MLAASDWRRGGFFSMAQENEKHSTPMVVRRMRTATELKQSIPNPQHRFVLNMDYNEVPPILGVVQWLHRIRVDSCEAAIPAKVRHVNRKSSGVSGICESCSGAMNAPHRMMVVCILTRNNICVIRIDPDHCHLLQETSVQAMDSD